MHLQRANGEWLIPDSLTLNKAHGVTLFLVQRKQGCRSSDLINQAEITWRATRHTRAGHNTYSPHFGCFVSAQAQMAEQNVS